MASGTLRREDALGWGLAIALHAGLIAWLVLGIRAPRALPPPQRMTVFLSEEAAPQSTAPVLSPAAAPDLAPEKGEAAAAPVPLPPTPRVEPKPIPVPVPIPVAHPKPQPKPKPEPKPKPAPAKPAPPKPEHAKPAHARPAPKSFADAFAKPAAKPGASQVGADFLKGVPGAKGPAKAAGAPAAKIGPAVKSALAGAVARQLKPHWIAPEGLDVDKLATTVEWSLARDGSLLGEPRVVSQTGRNDANAAQAERHKEQAVRAVRRAAPFNLPGEYYTAWAHLRFTFDWKLNQ